MTNLLVYIGETLVGNSFVNQRNGRVSSTFSYSNDYLAKSKSYQIDPEVELSAGNWHIKNELLGCFLDSSPDRWGRNLIKKKYPNKQLTSIDYLLETSDISRQGSLRFKTFANEEFLANNSSVPKLIRLGEIFEASNKYIEKQNGEAIKFLLQAGTASLGGARPKAIVEDKGELWIAKFPHKYDDYNVIEEEYKALEKAKQIGLNTPEFKLTKLNNQSILLVKRFDRKLEDREYKRIGYISAMTAIGAKDGEQRDYLEIIDFITKYGSQPKQDIAELLNRVRFYCEINNTDDHLRNHGFLWDKNGWKLSPLFDVNPDFDTNTTRVTSFSGKITQEETLLEVQKFESIMNG